ncbi:MAG: TlpA family protein disulfide reductase [Actinobacteria bacterium]|nr:TlpA family protein disulfide reductase [Actinomycetota bacterium]
MPCRRELPQLQKFAEANSSVSIVAVNLGDDAPSVRAYANDLGLTMPILLDAYGRISSAVGVASVPATILIRDKQVVATHLGEISAKELVQFVSQNS